MIEEIKRENGCLFIGLSEYTLEWIQQKGAGEQYIAKKVITSKRERYQSTPTRIGVGIPEVLPRSFTQIIIDLKDADLFQDQSHDNIFSLTKVTRLFGGRIVFVSSEKNPDILTEFSKKPDVYQDRGLYLIVLDYPLLHYSQLIGDSFVNELGTWKDAIIPPLNELDEHEYELQLHQKMLAVSASLFPLENNLDILSSPFPSNPHGKQFSRWDKQSDDLRRKFWKLFLAKPLASRLYKTETVESFLKSTQSMLFNHINVLWFIEQCEQIEEQMMLQALYDMLLLAKKMNPNNWIGENDPNLSSKIIYDGLNYGYGWTIYDYVISTHINDIISWVLTGKRDSSIVSIQEFIKRMDKDDVSYRKPKDSRYFKVKIKKKGKITLEWLDEQEWMDFNARSQQIIDQNYPELGFTQPD